ncbi:MAG: O-antigen ligase family protein [Bradymonadia bacterium]
MIAAVVLFLGLFVGLSIAWLGPIAALGITALASIPLCIRHPRYPVYVFVLTSFFAGANLNTGSFVIGLDDIGVLLIIGVWLARRLSARGDVRLPLGFGWLLLYATLAYLSLINGVSPDGYHGLYVRFLTRVIALFAFVDLVRSEQVLVNCLYFLGLSAVIHAMIAFSMDQSMSGRLGGLIDQPNILGTTLSLGLIPLIGLAQLQRGLLPKLLCFAAIVGIAVAIILTGSRGVYVALIPALIWSVRRHPARILVIGILGSLSLFSAKEYSQEQVQSIERRLQFRDVSVGKRTNVLDVAARLTMKFPLLGIGFGQISHAYKVINVEYDRGRTAHSFLVGIAASLGLPALMAMLLFLWNQFRGLIRHRASLPPKSAAPGGNSWLAEQAFTLFIFQFLSLVTRSAQMFDWAIFALFAALVWVIRAQEENDQSSPEGMPTSWGRAGTLSST